MKAFETTVSASIADTEAIVRSALMDKGFGVLTEIDVAATFKEKVGLDRSPLEDSRGVQSRLCQSRLEHRSVGGSLAAVQCGTRINRWRHPRGDC